MEALSRPLPHSLSLCLSSRRHSTHPSLRRVSSRAPPLYWFCYKPAPTPDSPSPSLADSVGTIRADACIWVFARPCLSFIRVRTRDMHTLRHSCIFVNQRGQRGTEGCDWPSARRFSILPKLQIRVTLSILFGRFLAMDTEIPLFETSGSKLTVYSYVQCRLALGPQFLGPTLSNSSILRIVFAKRYFSDTHLVQANVPSITVLLSAIYSSRVPLH